MDFTRKVELFHRALSSFGVGQAKAPFVGRANNAKQAKEIREAVAAAVGDYFAELGMADLVEEMSEEVCVVAHRFEQRRFAIAMRSALLPSGESEDGDWERVDDLGEGRAEPG